MVEAVMSVMQGHKHCETRQLWIRFPAEGMNYINILR